MTMLIILAPGVAFSNGRDFSWTGAGDGVTWTDAGNWTFTVGSVSTYPDSDASGTDQAVFIPGGLVTSSPQAGCVLILLTVGANGTLTPAGALTVNGPVALAGALTGGAGTITITGTLTGAGTFTASSGTTNLGDDATVTTFNDNSGSVVLDLANAASIAPAGGYTFYDLTINKAGAFDTVTAGGPWTVSNTITLTQGDLVCGAGLNHQIAGNWIGSAANFNLTPSTSTITMTVLAAVTSRVGNDFYDLTFNAGGAFGSDVTIANNLTVSGTLNVNDKNLTVGGDITGAGTLSASAGGLTDTIAIGGDWSITTFTSANSVVTFNGTGAQAFNPAGSSLYDLTVNATGPVNLGGALDVDNDLTLTAGTLAAAANGVNIAGDWVRTAGLFTSSGLVTFDGTGAQAFNGDGATFTNLTINSTGPVTLGGALDVDNDLTLTAGTLAAGANGVSLFGDFIRTAGVFTSTGVLTFDGTAAQAFNITGSTFTDITVNNTGPSTVTPNGALNIANLTLTAGTLVMAGNQLNVSGNWASTAGLLTSSGLAILDGGGAQAFNPVGSTLTDLTVNATGPVTLGGALDVDNDLTLTAGTLAAGVNGVNIAGDWVRTAGLFTSTGVLTFDGAGAQAFNPVGSTLTDVTVNATGPVNLSAALDVNNDLTLTAGTLAAGASGVNIAGDWIRTAGAFTSTGLVTFDGAAAQALNGAGATFTNLTINATGPVTLGGALDVDNDLTLTAGTLAAGVNGVNLFGDFIRTAGVFTSTGVLTFDGTAAQAFNPTGSTLFDVTLNCTGPVTISIALTVGNDLTLTAGALSLNNFDLSVARHVTGNSLDALAGGAAEAISVGGNWNVSAFTEANSLVTFTGASGAGPFTVTSNGQSFNDVTANAAAKTYQFGDAVSITGTLTISATTTADMLGSNFTIGTLSNNSVLAINGTQATQTITTMDTDSGLTQYKGGAGGTVRLSTYTFYNFEINGAGTFTLNAAITVFNDLYLRAGTLSSGGNIITVHQSFDSDGISIAAPGTFAGSFTHANSEVVFVNIAKTSIIGGSNTFYDFTCTTAQKVIEFDEGETTTIVAGASFVVKGTGASPNEVTLKSTVANPGLPPRRFHRPSRRTGSLRFRRPRFWSTWIGFTSRWAMQPTRSFQAISASMPSTGATIGGS